METPTTPIPRPWRRRASVRLSVRGLMALVVLVGAGLGWLVNRAAAHRRAVDVVRKAAEASRPLGYVAFDDVMVRDGKTTPHRKPLTPAWWSPARRAPVWLKRTLGDEFFHDVVGVRIDFARVKGQDPRDVLAAALRFRGLQVIYFDNPPAGVSVRGFPALTNLGLTYDAATGAAHPATFGDLPLLRSLVLKGDGVTDETLAGVSGSPNLDMVRIVSPNVTGKGLKHLARLSKLKTLAIDCPNLTDDGLEGLAPLTALQRLDLRGGPQVTDAGLAKLAGLSNLVALTVARTAMTDASFDRMGRMSSLEYLCLMDSPGVHGSGFPALARNLPKLPRLELTRSPVTDDALAGLAGLDALEHLNLWGTEVRGPGLKDLTCLPRLRDLWVNRTAVDDAALAYLEPLKALQRLNLAGDQITGAGLAHLAGLTELRNINLAGTRVDDAGLDHLRGLRKLRRIVATDTGVTAAGVERLRAALPTLGPVAVGKPARRPAAGRTSP